VRHAVGSPLERSDAHQWGRRLRAMGLDARLIAASFVSPYRMEGKSGRTT